MDGIGLPRYQVLMRPPVKAVLADLLAVIEIPDETNEDVGYTREDVVLLGLMAYRQKLEYGPNYDSNNSIFIGSRNGRNYYVDCCHFGLVKFTSFFHTDARLIFWTSLYTA